MSMYSRFYNAIRAGNVDRVKYFISIGLDPNIKDEDGCKPLALAFRFCNFDLANYLMTICIHNEEDAFGALKWALCYGHLDQVQYLFGKYYNYINQQEQDKWVWHTLRIACQNGYSHIVEWLFENYNYNVNFNPWFFDVDKFHDTHLISHTIWNNDITSLKLLIKYGASVNSNIITNFREMSPLELATKLGHNDIINYLTELSMLAFCELFEIGTNNYGSITKGYDPRIDDKTKLRKRPKLFRDDEDGLFDKYLVAGINSFI